MNDASPDRPAADANRILAVLFNLLGTPLMAKRSDRRGRRLVYTLDVALFALMAVASLALANRRPA